MQALPTPWKVPVHAVLLAVMVQTCVVLLQQAPAVVPVQAVAVVQAAPSATVSVNVPVVAAPNALTRM